MAWYTILGYITLFIWYLFLIIRFSRHRSLQLIQSLCTFSDRIPCLLWNDDFNISSRFFTLFDRLLIFSLKTIKRRINYVYIITFDFYLLFDHFECVLIMIQSMLEIGINSRCLWPKGLNTSTRWRLYLFLKLLISNFKIRIINTYRLMISL